MRIKLKNLLNLTEQAPQPPMGGDPLAALGNPAPGAGPAQPNAMNAGGQDQQQPEQPAAPETSPEPEDPSEYDFTRDFRAFEDKKNKAEADAKKMLLDKMNKRLLNKTIVANASRGYGQPKTDYTIKNLKKISVEFWYKDYVVIATDENDKKYFLTPGINIKIEGGSSEPAAGQPEDKSPAEDNGENQPTPQQPEGEPQQGAQEPPAENPQTPPQSSAQPQAQQPQKPTEQPEVPEENPQQQPPKKKKKVVQQPMAENNVETAEDEDENELLTQQITPDIVQETLGQFFANWFNVRKFDVRPYIKQAKTAPSNEDGTWYMLIKLEMPKEMFGKTFDSRDFALEFRDAFSHSAGPGQEFSRANVNVQSTGRFYQIQFILSGGRDI